MVAEDHPLSHFGKDSVRHLSCHQLSVLNATNYAQFFLPGREKERLLCLAAGFP